MKRFVAVWSLQRPVARFYAAVEAVRAAQLPADSDDVNQDCESLRTGTARYSTPCEDAALFAVLGAITVALIWAVVHFAKKAGLPW